MKALFTQDKSDFIVLVPISLCYLLQRWGGNKNSKYGETVGKSAHLVWPESLRNMQELLSDKLPYYCMGQKKKNKTTNK